LAPKFISTFKIIETRGEVAYQLELPLQLSDVYDVFHMSQLMKCTRVPKEQVSLEELKQAKISLTRSIRSRFWRCPRGSLETRTSEYVRYNGVITPKQKLPRKDKKSLRQNFLTSFSICLNLRMRFHKGGGGRIVTPYKFKENLKLYNLIHKFILKFVAFMLTCIYFELMSARTWF
jgi:hypothetical protein